MSYSIVQNVILVTGGAKGIGKGICQYLSKKNNIVIAVDIDIDAGHQLVADNPKIRFWPADVTNKNEMTAIINEVTLQFGRLNGLINNAAIANPYNTPLASLPLDEWQRIIDINLTAPLMITQQCLPLLKISHGNVINIASTRALQSEANTEAYSATKGGIVSLTHALAVSLGPEIKVNCISPGWINSSNEILNSADHQQHLVGRVGNTDDIAEMIEFLVCSQSGFITGQNFVIDGGMTKKMIYTE
ncbi:short-chain dehydrogenase [Photobacterium kishitanii]|uniref:KR domain-containing protein n=2 Tax=Photobacterium kishitanii TaxID=318456 RepID=A0AAX0YVV4_9GAMM|nr:SDR family oxidoreductase [Photobacterium kishitanii]KJG11690.1 short-chain dehydrogenase [Photobacterium kishitanii]KJG59000.1 short-chain dehydrogenase [Photobacterium kishitanii]KJG62075.1 short-chain dehydrogenase [Photobacterium kishitanii]KJG67194.1 short-chain dehydrogenase [Photobacterium kishitanii]KJG70561.1 short-chain dehydrogenase [Photobacterium kishitanii]